MYQFLSPFNKSPSSTLSCSVCLQLRRANSYYLTALVVCSSNFKIGCFELRVLRRLQGIYCLGLWSFQGSGKRGCASPVGCWQALESALPNSLIWVSPWDSLWKGSWLSLELMSQGRVRSPKTKPGLFIT